VLVAEFAIPAGQHSYLLGAEHKIATGSTRLSEAVEAKFG
jgi:hypothetical protein